MNKNIGLILFSIVFALFSLAVTLYAEEPEGNNITDTIEVSFAENQGNTETKQFSAVNTLKYTISRSSRAEWTASGLFSEAQGLRNAETYQTELIYYRDINPTWYFLERQGWKKDLFTGTKEEYSAGIGMGYRIKKGPLTANMSAGLDYKSEKLITDEERDYTDTRYILLINYQINSSNRLEENIIIRSKIDESRNYNYVATTSFISDITESLAFKVGYRIKYNNVPVPETLKRLDTLFNVALVIRYL
jgi:putative salt-induced outer membrane protein YdiY